MRFSVASWHVKPVQYWLDHGAYTMMASPPDWSRQYQRNLSLFTPPSHIVFGNVSELEYTRIFRGEMQRNLEAIKKWIDLQGDRHIILLCACPDGKFCHRLLVRKLLLWLDCEEHPLPDMEIEYLPLGMVVATAELTGCRSTNDDDFFASLSDREIAYGNYAPDRFGWVFGDIQRIEPPIPAKGAQGIWSWTPPTS